MARKVYVTTEPVVLEGFQAICRPSKFGYSLSCIITDPELIEDLEADRPDILEGQRAKLKNPKRATEKVAPWEEVSEGDYKIKFSWDKDSIPPLVDSNGTPITANVPIYSGSKVRVGFVQKGYTLKDGITYGTCVKLTSIQLISASASADVDTAEQAANTFGKYEGGYVTGNEAEPEEGEEGEEGTPDF